MSTQRPGRFLPRVQPRASRGTLGGIFAPVRPLDLFTTFVLMILDVRVLQGSSIASFTLFEAFVYLYCTPIIISRWLEPSTRLAAPCRRFLFTVCAYMSWLMFVSILALVVRSDSVVLQDAKNIAPMPVFSLFLFIRVKTLDEVKQICNWYVIYSLASCALGVCQYHFGGPYFRELIEGTEYKLDVSGNVLSNPAVGFSAHPNAFAAAILPAVTLSTFKLVSEIRFGWRLRPVTILSFAFLSLGMVLSQGRGAMLFTYAGIAFFLTPLGKLRGFKFKLLYVAGIVTFITLYGLQAAQTGGSPGADTIETRVLLWSTSFKAVFSDSYVFFFGDGVPFVSKWSEQMAGWHFPDAHNAWIDQFVFFGMPAVVFYLVIWVSFFSIVETAPKDGPSVRLVILNACSATIMAFMGNFFFEPAAHGVFPLSELFMFMSLGVLAAGFGQDAHVYPTRNEAAGPLKFVG